MILWSLLIVANPYADSTSVRVCMLRLRFVCVCVALGRLRGQSWVKCADSTSVYVCVCRGCVYDVFVCDVAGNDAHMNESCHVYHISMVYITLMNESWHTYQ